MHKPNSPAKQASYVQDVIFESGYKDTQRPALLSYIAASRNFTAADPSGKYNYLELGCSIGATTNGLAAANPQSRFYGIDFNEEHIAIASERAKACELTNVEYFQADFGDHERLDLPKFDYITIHGTYSWLALTTEAAIHSLVDKHLKKNGIFFVDYMSKTGKASIEPMWHLLRSIGSGLDGDSAQRAGEAFEILRLLVENDAGYFEQNSHAKSIFDDWDRKLKLNPRQARDLAHNALSENWDPKNFSEVAAEFSKIGLRFAGSCNLLLNDLEMALPDTLRGVGSFETDQFQLELIKEFYHHTQLRQDVFVRADADTSSETSSPRASKTHFAFLWPPEEKPDQNWWEFRDPENNPLEVDKDLIDQIVVGMSEGLTCAEEIAAKSLSENHSPDDVVNMMGRMQLVSNMKVFARPPEKLRKIGYSKVWPANRYNQVAIQRFLDGNQKLTLASPYYGGCISFPPLLSAVIAAFLSRKRCDLSPAQILKIIRGVPGKYQIGQNQTVDAKNLQEQMITSMCDTARNVILPNMVRCGALKIV